MSTSVLLAIAVLLTSTLSGVFAMGGGVILLAVMLNLLPVTQTMIYHGFIQFFANAFRALLHWRHISLRIMGFYLLGSVIGAYLLFQIIYVPNKAYILIFIGLITLFGPYLRFVHIDVTKDWGAVACGLFISWLNSLVGATGPLLNMFFLKSRLSRYEVIATKSATQSVAHLIKIVFYAGFFSQMADFPLHEVSLFLAFLCALTFLGGWLGQFIVRRMSEDVFRRYGYWIISSFGLVFTLQGIYLLLF